MTNDLPSVVTELVRKIADQVVAGVVTGHDWPNTQDELTRLQAAHFLCVLSSERDELASRVRELEGALCRISDMTYDSWTNGAIAKEIADAALNASKEQP